MRVELKHEGLRRFDYVIGADGLHSAVRKFGFGPQSVGKVTRFSLRLDPETRNMRTEIDLPNSDGRLYSGMYAEVSLAMSRHPSALTIPTAAWRRQFCLHHH